jgi:hypothetical protein
MNHTVLSAMCLSPLSLAAVQAENATRSSEVAWVESERAGYEYGTALNTMIRLNVVPSTCQA